MEEVQSWWEVPAIAHFCDVFRIAFNLFYFDVDELEASLLQEAIDDIISVENLIIRLLPACCKMENIEALDWKDQLCHLLQKKWEEEKGIENPLAGQNADFSFLPLRTKVEILYSLCHYRLDAEDVPEALKNIDGDDLRTKYVGIDSERNAYWYFNGIRLYKEDLTKKNTNVKQKNLPFNRKLEPKNATGRVNGVINKAENGRTKRMAAKKTKQNEASKSAWSVACYSLEDWNNLVKNLKKSRKYTDKKLSLHIEENFLPLLPEIMSRQERELRKRIVVLAPRRASERIDKVRRIKEHENLTATKAAEEERARKAAEEEKRFAKEEKLRKLREIEDRAKRAAERATAIEGRAKRAKLRERRIIDSEDSNSISESLASSHFQNITDASDNDYGSSEEEQHEKNDESEDKLDNSELQKSEDENESVEGSENEGSNSENEGSNSENKGSNGENEESNGENEESNGENEESNSENDESNSENGEELPEDQNKKSRIFAVQQRAFVDGNKSKYGRNYSKEYYNESCRDSRTQRNGAIVHRLTNYRHAATPSSNNLMERNSGQSNLVVEKQNASKANWDVEKPVPVSCDKRFMYNEDEANMSTFGKKTCQGFYLKKEQKSGAEAKFDILSSMPKNFPNMHHQVIK